MSPTNPDTYLYGPNGAAVRAHLDRVLAADELTFRLAAAAWQQLAPQDRLDASRACRRVATAAGRFANRTRAHDDALDSVSPAGRCIGGAETSAADAAVAFVVADLPPGPAGFQGTLTHTQVRTLTQPWQDAARVRPELDVLTHRIPEAAALTLTLLTDGWTEPIDTLPTTVEAILTGR